MTDWIEVLKYLSSIVAVLAPLPKVFLPRGSERKRKLQDRDRLITKFYDEGGVELPPFRREAALGAALGHTRLTASEIPLILSQKNPTSFIASYLKARGNLSPSSDGSKFELRSVAAKPCLRRVLQTLGVLLYFLLAISALWLLFSVAPKVALTGDWSRLAKTLMLAFLVAFAAIVLLIESAGLYWAAKLYAEQRKT